MPTAEKCLLFLAFIYYFAGMKKKFDTVCAFLYDTDWNAHFTMNFSDVCRHFGADRIQMDNRLYDVFGMSGDEIIGQYRQGPMTISVG